MAGGIKLHPKTSVVAERSARWHALGLALVCVMAAVLRARHLDWGLTQAPHVDEQYFVANVLRMLSTGSLDHGYYEYPGLMFYLLMPVLWLTGGGPQPDAAAFLAARGFVAVCGVAGVALVYVFGRRLLSAAAAESGQPRSGRGRSAALMAAALVAVSPVHVETAHMLRPDVTLELLVLLGFLAILGVGRRPRDDARAGVALGLAAGLKFSGGLAAVTYLLRRWLRPGARRRGTCLAAACAALTFAVVSPYALLHLGAFVEGVDAQLSYHYEREPAAVAPFGERLASYAGAWLRALGPLGAALALTGLVPALHRGARTWLPFLVLPPLTALVFATTGFVFVRHMLPSLGVIALLAGVTVESLATRRARLAFVLALVTLAVPLQASWSYLEAIARPSTRDRAAAWLASALPAPARVLTTLRSLRVDSERFEVQRVRRIERLQALDADAIVTTGSDETHAREVLVDWPAPSVLRPHGPYEGLELFVRLVPSALRPSTVQLDPTRVELSASANAAELEQLRDGRLDTSWHVPPEHARGAWIEMRWPAPVRLSRIDLLLGERVDAGALHLVMRVASESGGRWRRHEVLPGRPAPDAQLAAVGLADVLLFKPLTVRAVRLERRAGAHPWAVAELRLFAESAARSATPAGTTPAPPGS